MDHGKVNGRGNSTKYPFSQNPMKMLTKSGNDEKHTLN
jgi:hypothetical protein